MSDSVAFKRHSTTDSYFIVFVINDIYYMNKKTEPRKFSHDEHECNIN